MDPPVGAYSQFVHRVLWYAIMGILTIAVAFTAAFWVTAKGDYRQCVERNVNAADTNMALFRLAEAMEKDRDANAAASLRQFRDQRQSLPECSRPPFTRTYIPGE